MKILVTGSSGYIGTNLKPYLRSRGHSLTCYDIALSPFYDYDILNLDRLTLNMIDCDAVIHLAGLSGIDQCEADPKKAVETNVIGTRNVAATAQLNGQKMIFASSFAADNPINIYGMTKRLAEMIVLKHGGVVLRLSNVWGGPNYLKRKDSVIARFMKAKLSGEKAVIHGAGSQTRDFIHIREVCRAFIEALDVPSGVYNVCTGKETSIIELAKMIDVPFDFVENPRVTAKPTILDLPGWMPAMDLGKDLGKELRITIEIAKEIRKNASTWHAPA